MKRGRRKGAYVIPREVQDALVPRPFRTAIVLAKDPDSGKVVRSWVERGSA